MSQQIFNSPKKFLFASALVVLLTFSTITTVAFQRAREKLHQLSTPQGQALQAQQEAAAILTALKKLTVVPDEQPVVATIIDVKKLTQQSNFYAHAQDGDKLVLFQNAQRAYIYSPSRNLIINTGPLVVKSEDEAAQ